MNHKPGSVYVVSCTDYGNQRRCHLSGPLLTEQINAVYPRHKRAVPPLFDFAPDEACRAETVADSAVGSYPTFSPLPACNHAGVAVCFLLRLLSGAMLPPGCYPASCPAEPGLSSPLPKARRGSLIHRHKSLILRSQYLPFLPLLPLHHTLLRPYHPGPKDCPHLQY